MPNFCKISTSTNKGAFRIWVILSSKAGFRSICKQNYFKKLHVRWIVKPKLQCGYLWPRWRKYATPFLKRPISRRQPSKEWALACRTELDEKYPEYDVNEEVIGEGNGNSYCIYSDRVSSKLVRQRHKTQSTNHSGGNNGDANDMNPLIAKCRRLYTGLKW